jgi:hypothetical protein
MSSSNPSSRQSSNDRELRARLLRGWRALQRIRKVLEAFDVAPVPKNERGKCFDREGELLAQAVLEALCSLHRDLHRLEDAVRAVQPFVSNVHNSAGYPHALLTLNRTMGGPWLSKGEVERLVKELKSAPQNAAKPDAAS